MYTLKNRFYVELFLIVDKALSKFNPRRSKKTISGAFLDREQNFPQTQSETLKNRFYVVHLWTVDKTLPKLNPRLSEIDFKWRISR